MNSEENWDEESGDSDYNELGSLDDGFSVKEHEDEDELGDEGDGEKEGDDDLLKNQDEEEENF
ncbi:MAG: hypothetical protein WC565_02380 [Parcubacteria group bacterium]